MSTIIFSMAIDLERYMLPCMTKKFLGFDCPGCGAQRAVAHLLHGEFMDAFLMYPAIYPMIALFSFLGLKHWFNLKHETTITFSLMFVTTAAILINYILKFI